MTKKSNKTKRKVCFPIMSRVHYARQKLLLEALKERPDFDLQLVVGGSIFLEKYDKKFFAEIEKNFSNIDTSFNVIDGGTHVAMARTAGLTALDFANSLARLNPDIVLIRGDRFEQLAMAMTAAYLNKTIAHIEGGDLSGTIDESVRHAITKLAHIHFVTNEDSRKRVIKMGENPQNVFNVGSPDIEYASKINKKITNLVLKNTGTGTEIDVRKPYLVVMYHPVTTEAGNAEAAKNLLKAVDSLNIQTVWFWPNSDAGTNEISKVIRLYRENNLLKNNKIKFITHLLPDDFLALIKDAKVMIGNSSAGIKECSYFGTPVVNVGTRQAGRLRGVNVADAGYDRSEIMKAISAQLKSGRYPKSNIYYQPGTSQKIVEILAKAPLQTQKKFYESNRE